MKLVTCQACGEGLPLVPGDPLLCSHCGGPVRSMPFTLSWLAFVAPGLYFANHEVPRQLRRLPARRE